MAPFRRRYYCSIFDVADIFKSRKILLEKIEGIGALKASCIKSFTDFSKAEEEMTFIEKYKIKRLFITHENYPKRLLNCYDSPTLLYYKGEADLNTSKIVAVIGTRSHTDYGKQVTDQLIEDLKEQNVLVVSGLAYGIDAIAHKAAIKNNLSTVGVLAHGLDQVYPAQHKGLAKEMINAGAVCLPNSEVKPSRINIIFPRAIAL